MSGLVNKIKELIGNEEDGKGKEMRSKVCYHNYHTE